MLASYPCILLGRVRPGPHHNCTPPRAVVLTTTQAANYLACSSKFWLRTCTGVLYWRALTSVQTHTDKSEDAHYSQKTKTRHPRTQAHTPPHLLLRAVVQGHDGLHELNVHVTQLVLPEAVHALRGVGKLVRLHCLRQKARTQTAVSAASTESSPGGHSGRGARIERVPTPFETRHAPRP